MYIIELFWLILAIWVTYVTKHQCIFIDHCTMMGPKYISDINMSSPEKDYKTWRYIFAVYIMIFQTYIDKTFVQTCRNPGEILSYSNLVENIFCPNFANIDLKLDFFLTSNLRGLHVCYKYHSFLGASSIGSVSAWQASGPEFDPYVRHILSWRLGHENISTVILLLPLIQEVQFSVTGERMCTYW